MLRWILSLGMALLLGLSSIYWLTDGFSVVTAEGARRQSVRLQARMIPPMQVIDARGQQEDLAENLRRDGRSAIVNFFYTRCISLCLAQGDLTQRLQAVIEAEGLQDSVRLISISFDPRDGPDALARYANRMHADDVIWQFLSFVDPEQRKKALDLFGLTVIDAPLGEFEHNAALLVIRPDGYLTRIFDLEEPGLALAQARAENSRATK